MKPDYAKFINQFENSFNIRNDKIQEFYPHWHYHDEYELVYFQKSKGIRYVGDNISPYYPGDLVLLGSKLPHVWMNEQNEQLFEENLVAVTVIHFQRKFVHNDFFSLPLMEPIKNLFLRSMQGIRFINYQNIAACLNEIHNSQLTDKMIAIFKLLNQLSRHPNTEYLCSNEYQSVVTNQRNKRLSEVHEYIIQHFREKITLEDLSNVAGMTSPAFCNYFKNKTRKTVFSYINELRLSYSRKLLIDTDLNVDQIAFQSGFKNTTYYNRKFKSIMNITPKEYRKKFDFRKK